MSYRCQELTFAPRRGPGSRSTSQEWMGCEAIRYNFSVCVEGNLSRGVVTSAVSEPELKIDALP